MVGLGVLEKRKVSWLYRESIYGSSSPYPIRCADYASPAPAVLGE